jgi:hypothetical protein
VHAGADVVEAGIDGLLQQAVGMEHVAPPRVAGDRR